MDLKDYSEFVSTVTSNESQNLSSLTKNVSIDIDE